MTTEPRAIDPYDAVLSDLRAKRDEIDRAIKLIEKVRGPARGWREIPIIPPPATIAKPRSYGGDEPKQEAGGPFTGLTIPEATKKLLMQERRHMTNPELAERLAHGGVVMRSDDPANTIGSVLKRRQEEVGDLVRINPGRGGKWGLAEWGGEDPKEAGLDF